MVERRKVLLAVVSMVTLVLVTGIPRLELSDNWTRYFDQRYSFHNDTDFVIENLTGLDRLEYSLGFAILADFLLLPPLLMAMDGDKS